MEISGRRLNPPSPVVMALPSCPCGDRHVLGYQIPRQGVAEAEGCLLLLLLWRAVSTGLTFGLSCLFPGSLSVQWPTMRLRLVCSHLGMLLMLIFLCHAFLEQRVIRGVTCQKSTLILDQENFWKQLTCLISCPIQRPDSQNVTLHIWGKFSYSGRRNTILTSSLLT